MQHPEKGVRHRRSVCRFDVQVPLELPVRAAEKGERVDRMLVDLGFLSEEDLLPILAAVHNVEMVDASDIPDSPPAIEKLRVDFMRSARIVPIQLTNGTVVLAMAAMAGRRTSAAAEAAPGYIFALSTIGLAFVLYLGYAAYFVLGAFCILCAVTYVAVIALFIISGGATSFPMTSLPRRASRDVKTLFSTPAALGIALLLVAGAATAIAAFPREAAPPAHAQSGGAMYPPLTDQQRAEVEKWFDMQPTVEMPIPKGDAKVLVVKFNDYQCPPCRQSYELYGPILDKYTATGQVKFVLKHFPLEPECNPTGSPQTVHPASCEAAAAVVMAEPKGTAGKLEAWLFANQGPPLLTPAQVKEAARDGNVPPCRDAEPAR